MDSKEETARHERPKNIYPALLRDFINNYSDEQNRLIYISIFGCATQLVGSQLPSQGLNPGPSAVKAPAPNSWTIRKLPRHYLIMAALSSAHDSSLSHSANLSTSKKQKTKKPPLIDILHVLNSGQLLACTITLFNLKKLSFNEKREIVFP